MNKVFDPTELETDEGMSLPDLMKKKRADLGMTQSDLAKATGLTLSAIKQYETGRAEPPHSKVRVIAKTLGLSAGELWSEMPAGDPSSEQQKMEAMRQATSFIMGDPSPKQLTDFLDFLRTLSGAEGDDRSQTRDALDVVADLRSEGRKGRPLVKAVKAAMDYLDGLNLPQLEDLADRFDVQILDETATDGLEDRILVAALYGVDVADLGADALEAIRSWADPDEDQTNERDSIFGLIGESEEEFITRMARELPPVLVERALEGRFVSEKRFQDAE